LTQVRQRWIEMSRLRDAALEYSRALRTEEERLGISRWLLAEARHGSDCPVCGSKMDKSHNHLQELVSALGEVEGGQTVFRTLPPTFDREYARVRSRMGNLTQQLNGVQRRMRGLQEASDNARQRRYTELATSRFIGKVESELAVFDRYNSDDELRKRREELVSEITALSREVDEKFLKESEKRAIDRLSALSSPLLPDLGVEESKDPFKISTNDLTLKVQRLDREDWLSEIGSGSNWVGYHLASSLGFQRYFLQLLSSPVPSFLVFDQPSQVFFPKKLAGVSANPDPKLDDDDVVRVSRMFEVIAKVTAEQGKKLQTIVLDHAAENVWGNIPGIHLVEEWRDSAKLIPETWLE
jgi:Protein of unknown function (DUF3732)